MSSETRTVRRALSRRTILFVLLSERVASMERRHPLLVLSLLLSLGAAIFFSTARDLAVGHHVLHGLCLAGTILAIIISFGLLVHDQLGMPSAAPAPALESDLRD